MIEEEEDNVEHNNTNSNDTPNPYSILCNSCSPSSSPSASTTVIARSSKIIDTTEQGLPPSISNFVRMVIDSGATHTIVPHSKLFQRITFFNKTSSTLPTVLMGDDTTEVPILGYGIIQYKLTSENHSTICILCSTIRKNRTMFYTTAYGEQRVLLPF